MSQATREARTSARVVLGVLVGAFIVLFLLSSGPLGASSLALQASPSGSNAYRIEFLSPSTYAKEISAKDDTSTGEGKTSYHLVAWVNALPASPSVEFRYTVGDGDEETIGTATQVTPGDTFEYFWTPPDDMDDDDNAGDDEDITLIAVLSTGSQELDRDTHGDFFVNNKSTDPTDPDPLDPQETARGEAVEFSYPLNGADLGFFKPRDQPANAVPKVTVSAQTTFVKVLYTVSVPGSEPNWVACGTQTKAQSDSDGVRCTLGASHQWSQVTAMAAVANDTQATPVTGYNAANDDAGDAHRVLPYGQIIESLVVDPAQRHDVQAGMCSEPFTISLLDQAEIPVAGANTDVHAQGPGDNLKFGNTITKPTGTHTAESTVDCSVVPPLEDTETQQGEHNSSGADVKHAEPAATNDAGKTTFQLYSPTQGTTQLVAWADVDENDVFCTTEANDDASVGWREPAPSPQGLEPEQTDCPLPTPTPSVSSTTSPSPTPEPTDTGDPRGCTIVGDDNDNTLTGTEGDDVICAYGGNDIIQALGGNDLVYGDEGSDE
ncbi:MAG TPA: hypothetical protein VE174_07365, partial [Actinomycetota bacterium]|nr:hypothetical protein [Actinomycetota bacterium]